MVPCDDCEDEHKLKLINYEKKLLKEKKITHSSKSIEVNVQKQPEAPMTIDINSINSKISMPHLEEEEEEKSESMQSYIRLPKKESLQAFLPEPSIVPPVEEVVDIEYDKILNLGVQRIMEERKNIFRFSNISKNFISWKIQAEWHDDKEPAVFRFSEDEGELEAGQNCKINIFFMLD